MGVDGLAICHKDSCIIAISFADTYLTFFKEQEYTLRGIRKHRGMYVAALVALLCIGLMLWGFHARFGTSANTVSESTYETQAYSLERNNIDIHLDCMRANGAEPTDNILLIHGLTYSSHEFDVDYKDYSLVRFLCDNGYAVWRLDITGYGQSGQVDDGFTVDSGYASEDICAAIDRILEITNAEAIDLLGWSWGTVTSSLAEQKSGGKIDKLVLYAPILAGLGHETIADGFHQNSWEHAASDFQANEDGSISEAMVDMAVVHIYCSNCWKFDQQTSPNGGRRDLCVDKTTQLIDLTAITSPTLIICGDKDPYMNMALVRNSESMLPQGSHLEIVQGASHVMYIEKPYYHHFQNVIIDFLKSA